MKTHTLRSISLFLIFIIFTLSNSSYVLAASDTATVPTDPAQVTYPYQKSFTISAYYSPLLNQKKYVTGSYDGDIRLNGGGVHGADGNGVYPGMIAAPSSYPFGMKMKIPTLGTVAVHDRGGAIVHAGEKKQLYDRLDVWMGYGDAGLERALNWGKRTLEVTVYGIDPSIQEDLHLLGYTEQEKFSVGVTDPADNALFVDDLSYGDTGDKVGTLQNSLKTSHFYTGEISNIFDAGTQDALILFQIQAGIIDDKLDFGAGYFGPKTRAALEKYLKGETLQVDKNQLNNSGKIVSSSTQDQVLSNRLATMTFQSQTENVGLDNIFDHELAVGDHGDEVTRLQEELQKVNFLGFETTGYFGEVTRHAVFKFQQSQNIVQNEQAAGAGVLGPMTRKRLNLLISAREQTAKLIAVKQRDQAKVRLALQN